MVEIGNKLNHEDVKFFIAQGMSRIFLSFPRVKQNALLAFEKSPPL